MFNKDHTYGLVLDGGGTRGAFQIGAWRALRESDIKIEAVVGTSVGSINGAFLAADSYDRAVRLWETMDYSKIFGTELTDFGKILKDKGIDVSPLRALISKEIDEQAVRMSPVKFGLATLNLSDWKEMDVFIDDIPKGMLCDYIMASAYLPFFKSEKLAGGITFLDGGIYNNSPVNMLLDDGYRHIIVIKLGEHIGIEKKVDTSTATIREVLPSEDLGSLIDVDQTKIIHNMQLGYCDTLRMIEGLAGRRYYIRPDCSRRWDLPADDAEYFAKRLKLGKHFQKDQLAYAALDFMADAIGLERLTIYSCDDLLVKIKKQLPFYLAGTGYSEESRKLEHLIGSLLMNV